MTAKPHLIRQAIVTKWHGPTKFKGSRVSAKAEAGRVILHWDHALNVSQNHSAAAQALADKFGWKGNWYQGATPRSGYAFVCIDDRIDAGYPAFTR